MIEQQTTDRLKREEEKAEHEQRMARIEDAVIRLEDTKAIVNSNSRAIQAMMEQQATDRLKREEEKAEHKQRMARIEDTVIRLDDTVARLVRIEEAQNRMLATMDNERPTILRRLMAIENKVDSLIEGNQ